MEADDPLRPDIALIQDTADRAADLTRQLLAFSRRQVLQPAVLNLNTVVANMGEMLRRLIGENIALVIALDPTLERVKADRSQIEQIIMNLAANARDAMPEGGRLTLETANVDLDATYARRHVSVRPGRYVLLGVSDSGIRMTEAKAFHAGRPRAQGPGGARSPQGHCVERQHRLRRAARGAGWSPPSRPQLQHGGARSRFQSIDGAGT